jgi:hypothetical protein
MQMVVPAHSWQRRGRGAARLDLLGIVTITYSFGVFYM